MVVRLDDVSHSLPSWKLCKAVPLLKAKMVSCAEENKVVYTAAVEGGVMWKTGFGRKLFVSCISFVTAFPTTLIVDSAWVLFFSIFGLTANVAHCKMSSIGDISPRLIGTLLWRSVWSSVRCVYWESYS